MNEPWTASSQTNTAFFHDCPDRECHCFDGFGANAQFLITEPIDDSEGIPVPDADLPDGLVVEPATDNVKIPDGDKPAEPAEGEPA